MPNTTNRRIATVNTTIGGRPALLEVVFTRKKRSKLIGNSGELSMFQRLNALPTTEASNDQNKRIKTV